MSAVRITLCGAAGTVTGSGYLVETPSARVLLDFGMFQGDEKCDELNRSLGPVDPASLSTVVLTHAHLDHCGRLPLLTKAGYAGPIVATPASIDLARMILFDSAGLQEQDADRARRHAPGRGAGVASSSYRTAPLYTRADVEAMRLADSPLGYAAAKVIAPGVTITFHEAGHIMGSASVEMTIEHEGRARTIVFSGDIGPRSAPILRDPAPPRVNADLVFLESTYGDRDHPPLEETVERFITIIRDAIWQQQRVLIPAFAVGRTQLLLYHLAGAIRDGKLPQCPVYLDSPAAQEATAVYARHHDLYDKEAADLRRSGHLREHLGNLRMVESVEASKRLNESRESCIIIAGSGMCDGGRIVHHLRHNLSRRGTAVVIVGYMAEGTLGRRLVRGDAEVPIFGDMIPVRASVHSLTGFSAHAGQTELLDWLEPMIAAKPRVVLTHGEDKARKALTQAAQRRFGIVAATPMRGDEVTIA